MTQREETEFPTHGAAGALGTTRSLMDSAPMGRAFASIASLTELSRRIETSLEAGDRALALGDARAASHELSAASALMERMRKLSDSIDLVERALARPAAVAR